jgi:hypothetical protein
MKKHFLIVIVAAAVSGCSFTPNKGEPDPGVVRIDSNIYKAFDTNIWNIPGAVNGALQMANNYCEDIGKETLVQSSRGWYTPLMTGRGSVIFVCMGYGDDDTKGYRQRSAKYNKQRHEVRLKEIDAELAASRDRQIRLDEATRRSQQAIPTYQPTHTTCQMYGGTMDCTTY